MRELGDGLLYSDDMGVVLAVGGGADPEIPILKELSKALGPLGVLSSGCAEFL